MESYVNRVGKARKAAKGQNCTLLECLKGYMHLDDGLLTAYWFWIRLYV